MVIRHLRSSTLAALAVTLVLAVACAAQAPTQAPSKPLDVPYVPTHEMLVEAMLEVAKVGKNDILYDLGSGDGRIVITAAKKYGTRGTGIDLDPVRIAEANENAQKAGVTHLVKFIQGDIFEASFSDATVVTMYLLPDVNLKLRPKILALKPGTRIVSHNYDMGDWKPLRTLNINVSDTPHQIYFWTVPARK
jgi:hypothetical protein